VVRVVCARDGTPQYVEHKWPFGNPQNIGTLRVPWGYRHMIFGPSIGGQLTNNGHRPSLEQGYGGLFMWALLPDVSPHNQRVPPVVETRGQFDLVTVQVSPPAPSFVEIWTTAEWLRRRRISLQQDLNIGPVYRDMPLVRKESRFGLNRIGPEKVVIDPSYELRQFKPGLPPYKDLWFNGDKLEISTTIIVCGSDYISNGEREIDNNPRTLCHHEFAHSGINSGIRLTYWKMHHENWRSIQERVTSLLDSFKNPPPAKD
jgi:hypothetical protein